MAGKQLKNICKPVQKRKPRKTTPKKLDLNRHVPEAFIKSSSQTPNLLTYDSLLMPPPPAPPPTPTTFKPDMFPIDEALADKVVKKPLLLAYKYPINEEGTKSISVGFDPDDENFQAVFLIENIPSGTHILMSADEWYIFYSKRVEIGELLVTTYTNLLNAFNQLSVMDYEGNPTYEFSVYISERVSIYFNSLMMEAEFRMIDSIFDENPTTSSAATLSTPIIMQSVLISCSEFSNMLSYLDYMNSLITHHKTCSTAVKLYYDLYLKKCKQVNEVITTLSNYFSPLHDQHLQSNPTPSTSSSSQLTSTTYPSNYAAHSINYFRLYNEISIICAERTSKHLAKTEKP